MRARTASIYVLSKNKKNIKHFQLKNVIFIALKIVAYCIVKSAYCTARYRNVLLGTFPGPKTESLRTHVCIYLQIGSYIPSGAILGDRLAKGRDFSR